MIRVGDTYRAWFAFVASKVGKAGLTVTVDVVDESGNVSAGNSASAGAVDGMYYYEFTVDAPGVWTYVGKTTDATVDAQHVFGAVIVEAALTAARAANLDNLDAAVSDVPTAAENATAVSGIAALANLDAAVSSRSTHSAADVWSVSDRTLSSFGTLVADIKAAIWSAAERTLTTLSGLIGTGNIQLVGGVIEGGAVIVYQGDAYQGSRALTWTETSFGDLSDKAITVTVKDLLGPGSDFVSADAVGGDGVVTLELDAADTGEMEPGPRYDIPHKLQVRVTTPGDERVIVESTWIVREVL
jgi:hypothetical protein